MEDRTGGIQEVVHHLYICGSAAVDQKALAKLGIRDVVNVSGSDSPSWVPDSCCFRVDVEDQPEAKIEDCFVQTNAWIDRKLNRGRKVLVYCARGESRSPTIIAAYLITKRGKTLKEVLSRFAEIRPQISINDGFMAKLKLLKVSK